MLHLLFVPVLLIGLLIAIAVRVITAPFRMFHHHRWYRGGWGYGRYAYGRPRGMGLLTVLALVALERLFDRRY
jgi:hypothetical protein